MDTPHVSLNSEIPSSSENVSYLLVYLILFRHENVAEWAFHWCLSHKKGAHRLSSSNDLHEMQNAGISLDNSIFSTVQPEEDNDDDADGIDEQGNPGQPLAAYDGTIHQLLLQK